LGGFRWLSPPANFREPSGLKGKGTATVFLKMLWRGNREKIRAGCQVVFEKIELSKKRAA